VVVRVPRRSLPAVARAQRAATAWSVWKAEGATAYSQTVMTERLFILDGPGYLYRAYHALPFLSTSKGVPAHAVFGVSTMVWKLLREEQPDYMAVAWDPPGRTFRADRFQAYKESRAPMPDDLRSQIPLVRELFAALRLPILEVPGFEADDVLGTVVDRLRDWPGELVLVTGDKDMLQLVGPRVRVLSTMGYKNERVVYDEAKVREMWGCRRARAYRRPDGRDGTLARSKGMRLKRKLLRHGGVSPWARGARRRPCIRGSGPRGRRRSSSGSWPPMPRA
jgi:5'-3' exonuclease, N-terminal resolvase-like domain